ncbi:MAG: DUF4244 domain-containing protein [Propionibacteriaceae bacterium]|jgi:hypothetical protein|nr:DUF4244 domain-containing protein [Propionibacteriaceae bacterium]
MKQLVVQSRLARWLRALHARGEAGMALAEYAIGILIVAGVGFVVFSLIKAGAFSEMLNALISSLLKHITDLWIF